MSIPFVHRGMRAKLARPFNVSRWFAIVGMVSIAAVSTACAFLLSRFLTDRMLHQEGVSTMEFVQSVVGVEHSLREYFASQSMRDAEELTSALRHIAALPDTLRANIYNRDRTLIWSTDASLIGRTFGPNPELDAALAGQLVVHNETDEHTRKEEHEALVSPDSYFVEIYVPVRDPAAGQVIGAVELYKSPTALAEALRSGKLFTTAGAAGAGLFLYLALFGLSRRADAVIRGQQQRLLENEVLATVGEMGSAVAHGIRNPLAAIRSSAELMLDGDGETARESARDIVAEADRLEAWIRELLSYARPVGGTAAAVELHSVVEAAVDHCAREMEKRAISSRCEVARNLPLAKADPALLGQVLRSLLANAIEAIKERGAIEVAGRISNDEQRIELSIKDSGCGMTQAQLERIFTPFYTTKPNGLGVGLALAKRVVERFGGRIAIDSAPGRGTTVNLSLPVA